MPATPRTPRAQLRASGVLGKTVSVSAVLVPAALVFALLLAIYSDWFPGRAAPMAVVATLCALALVVPVWMVTGLIEWPDQLNGRFYLVHLALAVVFAVLWIALDLAATQLLFSKLVAARKLISWGWEGLLGSWLYGQVAGVSYAIRAQTNLRSEREAAVKLAKLAAEAQLRALRAQLNPHFLFNALHSLSALIRSDPNAADEAIDRLGGLLRYAMSRDEQATATVDQDLAFARDYLALEQLRLGERLRVDVAADGEALESEIPAFTLQPLLENAVRHGIDMRPEGGTVALDIRLHGTKLRIAVTDNGIGANPDALASAKGLGLRALRERLTLAGHPFALDIDSAPGKGFSVTLVLDTGP